MAKFFLIGSVLALMAAGATTLGFTIPKQAAAQHHADPAIFWQLQIVPSLTGSKSYTSTGLRHATAPWIGVALV
jgi:hypothetical protein